MYLCIYLFIERVSFTLGNTDFGAHQHICDNWSQVVEWGFLKEYTAKREEANGKTLRDIKNHYVGRGRRDFDGDLE